ncbi:unannotated protein [freshwater metagenome]|uniref:Unannotated protein n=1 Tax=freshwater metagenome TaxID=449393 RepID=A0A6J6DL02_9ZZZZ
MPAEPAGVVQVIDVADTTFTFVHAAPPTVTVAPAAKPVPVIVIDVPPAVEPEAGDTADTVATGAMFPEYFLITDPLYVLTATNVSPAGVSDERNVPLVAPDPGSQPVQLDAPASTKFKKDPVDESRANPDST